MLPILFLVGGGFLAWMIARSSGAPTIKTRVRGALPGRRPSLARLISVIRQGEEPPAWLVNDAMAEAYDLGDWKTVARLHDRFAEDIAEDMEDEEQPREGSESEEGENEPPDQDAPPVEIVVGKNSPFEGVPNDAWDRFVSSLETQAPEFQGPKHIGRFHHSRERLAQLQIDDVSTPEKQYEALVKDLTDAREKSIALIRDFEFLPIALDRGEESITLSGILAVIKSAGMEHARSWFVNPDDRKKFPKTTEMFLKANGVF